MRCKIYRKRLQFMCCVKVILIKIGSPLRGGPTKLLRIVGGRDYRFGDDDAAAALRYSLVPGINMYTYMKMVYRVCRVIYLAKY